MRFGLTKPKRSIPRPSPRSRTLICEALESRELMADYNFVPIAHDMSGGLFKAANVSLNRHGIVAFEVHHLGHRSFSIRTGDGGPLTTVAESSGTILRAPQIADDGTIAFAAGSLAGDLRTAAVHTAGGWPNAPVADRAGPFDGFGKVVDVAGTGVFAFRAHLDSGAEGIYTASAMPVFQTTNRANTTRMLGNPSINGQGAVAFHAFNGIHVAQGDSVATVAGEMMLPALVVYDHGVNEGNTGPHTILVPVELSGGYESDWDTDSPITVDFATVDGSALAGQDYEAVSGTLEFKVLPSGLRERLQYITVPIIGDKVPEAGEHFFVRLKNPSGVRGMPHAVITDDTAVFVIVNDDPHVGPPCGGRPNFGIMPEIRMTTRAVLTEGNEDTRYMEFQLTLTRHPCYPEAPMSVQVSTIDGSALAGQDYFAVNDTIPFPSGTHSATVKVRLRGDLERESAREEFYLKIQSDDAIVRNDIAVGVIQDDDGTLRIPDQIPAINSAGNVAYVAQTERFQQTRERALYVAHGGQSQRVVDMSGAFDWFLISEDLRTIAMNSTGTLAFHARLDDGRYGIYTGPDPEADKVVVEGDVILGRKVWKVIPTVDINDSGEIAFAVWHDEWGGTVGIYRAAKRTPSIDRVTVERVEFTGGYTVHGDTGKNPPYLGPHWEDTNRNGQADPADKQNPYSYKLGDTLKLVASFRLKQATALPGPVLVCGDVGEDGPDPLDIPCRRAQQTGDLVQLTYNADPSNKFKTVDAFNKIAWRMSPDDGLTWIEAGTSASPVYVTLQEPVSKVLLRTVVHIGSTAARGASTPDDVIAKVWNEFSDQDVRRVNPTGSSDDDRLTYYRTFSAGKCTNVVCLLSSADAQCGGWADLFRAVLHAQGIKSDRSMLIEYVTLTAQLWRGERFEKGFLIHNWEFRGSGLNVGGTVAPKLADYPFINIPKVNSNAHDRLISDHAYEWQFAEVTDLSGVGGQGTTNPASLFSDHQLIRITRNGQKPTIYDPSYGGRLYNSLEEYEQTVIAGYWVKHRVNITTPDGRRTPHWAYFIQRNHLGMGLNVRAREV